MVCIFNPFVMKLEVILDKTAAENSVVQSAVGALRKEGKQTYWVGALSSGNFSALAISDTDQNTICTQLEEQRMVPVFLGKHNKLVIT